MVMVMVDIWQLHFLGGIIYHYKVYINNTSENKASKSGNTYFPNCVLMVVETETKVQSSP